MHMDEIGDFLLGWFGLDIMNDDEKVGKAAPKPETKPGK
jgi:hypothetical protein